MRKNLLKTLVEAYAPEMIKAELRAIDTAEAVIREARRQIHAKSENILARVAASQREIARHKANGHAVLVEA